MAPSEVGPFLDGLRRILVTCQQLPVPTICAIDGPAVGGGLEVALTCDMRIACKHTLNQNGEAQASQYTLCN